MSLDAVFLIDGVVLSVVCVSGLLGTCLAINVLVKPRLRTNFSNFLTALAVCDALFLLIALLIFGLPSLWRWYGTSVAVHAIPFCHGLLHVARTGSVYVTLAVTLERYLAVVHPLRKFGYAKRIMLPFVFGFAIIYNLPKFFEMETYVWPFTNETAVRPTSLRTHPDYEALYTFWSKIIVMEFGPYITLIVLNAIIVVKIVRASNFRRKFRNTERNRALLRGAGNGRRQNSNNEDQNLKETNASARRARFARASRSSNVCRSLSESLDALSRQCSSPTGAPAPAPSAPLPKQQEVSLALTLVGISILFVVCQSVKIITDVYELFCEKIEVGETRVCKSTHFIDMAISLANLSTCINSAANFLVYMLRGKKFRDVFLNTYCCTKNNANENNNTFVLAQNSNCMPMATRPHLERPSIV